jgi:hypothetical protein
MIEFARENQNVRIKLLSVTLRITLSSRFLLMLFPERARHVTWVVAPTPAGWAFE